MSQDMLRRAASFISFSQRVCEWDGMCVLTSRELSTVGHGNRCHDDPQRSGHGEGIDQEGPPVAAVAPMIMQASLLACISIATSRLPVRS
jgi:hypothetical protein